jgi:N-acetylmuramoyl-L-alanine amidase
LHKRGLHKTAFKTKTLATTAFFLCLSIVFTAIAIVNTANAEAVGNAVVTDIRHWSNPSYTRIVIGLDKKASFTHKLLEKDPSINVQWRRLYVDIDGAMLNGSSGQAIPINDGLLKTARAAQHSRNTVRVVLDIESIDEFKVFALEEPFRIVIDVTGGVKKEPDGEPIKKDLPFNRQSNASPAPLKRVTKIVIDPGHGGRDPGAIGRTGLKEKDVTLKLSRLLKKSLNKSVDAVIVMTRDSDVFIPLEERTAIANREDADLFISIHVNASPRRKASGIETYMLSIAKDAEARRLAARENSTTAKAVSDLEFILSDLMRTARTNESARLASFVQEDLVVRVKKRYSDVRSNGVKGAPFYVLVGTNMPSILVEVSYISNPTEEKRLKNDQYLQELVDGISAGLNRYLKSTGAA